MTEKNVDRSVNLYTCLKLHVKYSGYWYDHGVSSKFCIETWLHTV